MNLIYTFDSKISSIILEQCSKLHYSVVNWQFIIIMHQDKQLTFSVTANMYVRESTPNYDLHTFLWSVRHSIM